MDRSVHAFEAQNVTHRQLNTTASLGDGWQNYQSVPAIRRPQPAVLAVFRRALESSEPKGNSPYQISDLNPPK